jgi:hypothetical protein
MGNLKHGTILLGIVLVALTIIAPLTVYAQTSTKPAVPEFSLKYFEHPYDVPPTTSVDPYTGKTVTVQEGYHIENRSIEVVIKNQPFSSYTDSVGNNIALLYNIRWKGHFEDSWKYCAGEPATFDNTKDYVHASGSTNTVAVGGLNSKSADYNFFVYIPSGSSQGGQVDFQVKALFGYSNRVYAGDQIPLGATYYYNFTGAESDWSNIQTFNLDNNSTTTASPTETAKSSQNPETTPTKPVSQVGVIFGFDWEIIALVVAVIAVLTGAVVVLWRNRTTVGK